MGTGTNAAISITRALCVLSVTSVTATSSDGGAQRIARVYDGCCQDVTYLASCSVVSRSISVIVPLLLTLGPEDRVVEDDACVGGVLKDLFQF